MLTESGLTSSMQVDELVGGAGFIVRFTKWQGICYFGAMAHASVPKQASNVQSLLGYVARSMTPFHAVEQTKRMLTDAGFSELDERQMYSLEPGDRRFVTRGGSTIISFVVGHGTPSEHGFRMIGAHTDSPNLHIKPRPDAAKSGYKQVGVEVYGGALLSTWLDRDLSVAGRISFGKHDKIESVLIDFQRAIGRVPNLAIHLNRGVNTEGLVLNAQKHLVPVVGLGDEAHFLSEVARLQGIHAREILGFDLSLYDVIPPALGGLDGEFIFSARLDNLASCFAATQGLIEAADQPVEATLLTVLYDHEECGSRSAVGAQGTVLRDTLRRIVSAREPRQDQSFERAMRRSFLISADMAHAVHPNYSDLHEPQHLPKLGGGLVIKVNANQSYATSGETAARFALACQMEDLVVQHYVVRSDLPCGSTIGSITAAELGIDTVDVGAPMLSMHSCREMASVQDVDHAVRVYRRSLLL